MPACRQTRIMRQRFGALVLATAVGVASAPAAIRPDRYGALYASHETARFELPANAVSWRVLDVDGVVRGGGRTSGTALALDGPAVGNRLGAFRLAVALSDGQTNETWFARLSSRKVAPCPWVGTGTHGSHGWDRGDLRFVDLIAAAGIGVVRDEAYWDNVEKAKGSYVLPPALDAYLDRLAMHGIRMNLVLDYGNRLYENPLDPEAFSRYCAWIARRLKGRIGTFEIWNEPQNFGFSKRYHVEGASEFDWVDKFVELTHLADDAIRAADPNATVAVAAEDWDKYLNVMLQRGVARAHNVVTFHPYCHFQYRPERAYFLHDFGRRQRELAKANGGADRWAVTEAGWTTFEGKGEFWEVAGVYPRASFSGQASCIVRMYLSALEAGCEYACQYDFMNDGDNSSSAEDNFGLVFRDGSPKPSFAAVANLTRVLEAATFAGELSTDTKRYRVAKFLRTGAPVLAMWAIEGEVEIDVPAEMHGGTVVDLFGNMENLPEGGKIRLAERPVYVVGVPSETWRMWRMRD